MITKEDIEELSKKANEILQKASQTQNYEERKSLHAQYDHIFMKINDATKEMVRSQIEDDFKQRGIDPYGPCPTCGKTILEKRK